MDFLLSENASGFWITPARSHPPHVISVLDPSSASWSFPTAFPAESAGGGGYAIRARALAATDTDIQHAADLLMLHNATVHRNTAQMAVSVVDTQGPHAVGSALQMAIAATCKEQCVASMSQRFTPPLDLTGRRHLSITVKGDGSGSLVVIQLQTMANQYRDYFVELNFTGWKDVQLFVPETRGLFEHRGGMIPTNVAMSMRSFDWTLVAVLNIYVRLTSSPQRNYSWINQAPECLGYALTDYLWCILYIDMHSGA